MVDITMEHLANPKGVGIIVLHNDRVLLGKRKDSGQWSLAGGGIEPGEQPKEAAIRELFEEFGIKVTDLAYYGVTPSPANPFKPTDSRIGCSVEYWVEFFDLGEIEVILEPKEFTEYKWVTLGEALYEFDLYPNSKSSLELFYKSY